MRRYIGVVLMSLLSYFAIGQSISSSVVATAGESTESGGISISWTLGELAIETLQDNAQTLTLTQGFQQGYFEITSIEEPLSNNFSIKMYPNPATEYVWVKLESEEIKDAYVALYDIDGKIVYNSKVSISEGAIKIDLTNLNSSYYILRLTDESSNLLQSFKLIKR